MQAVNNAETSSFTSPVDPVKTPRSAIDQRLESVAIKIKHQVPKSDLFSSQVKRPPKVLSCHWEAYNAIEKGNEAEFLKICEEIKTKAKIGDLDVRINHFALMQVAAKKGSLLFLKKLVKLGGEYRYDKKNQLIGSPLYIATDNHHSHIVKYLLKHGAPPDDFQKEEGVDRSPLCVAAGENKSDSLESLLAYGANPNKPYAFSFKDIYPLNFAFSEGNVTNFKMLLGAKADFHLAFECDPNALIRGAASRGHTEMVRFLVEELGLDINYQDKETGNTALFNSYANKKDETTKLLLELGANPKIENLKHQNYREYGNAQKQNESFEFLCNLFRSGGPDFKCAKLVDKLLADIYTINLMEDKTEDTLLHNAAHFPDHADNWIIKLLRLNNSPDVPNSLYETPLLIAEKSLKRLRKELKEYESSSFPESMRQEVRSKIAKAEEVIKLMRSYSNPKLHAFYKCASILNSRKLSYKSTTYLFNTLEKINDLNFQDKNGDTLLHIAFRPNLCSKDFTFYRNVKHVTQLLRRGADLNLANKKNETFMKYSEQVLTREGGSSSIESFNKLINAMKNREADFVEKQWSIYWKLCQPLREGKMTDELWKEFDNLFDVNMPFQDGNTLLHEALKNPKANFKYLRALERRGVSLQLQNHEGKTAVDLFLSDPILKVMAMDKGKYFRDREVKWDQDTSLRNIYLGFNYVDLIAKAYGIKEPNFWSDIIE